MAQPNVVREPSMDEILASIRRIIESNEPVPQAGVATGSAEPEGFMGYAANDDAEEVTLTIDEAFASRQDYAEPEPVMAAPAPVVQPLRSQPVSAAREQNVSRIDAAENAEPMQQPKSLSLADVAARVRAASERGQAERSAAMREEKAPQPVAAPAALAFEAAFEPEVVEAAPEVEIAVDDIIPATANVDEQPAAARPISLLSSAVGEQVARSFQDLAFAVDDAERRSLDQMAEDMLRPMLQEWLDDNLPTLVERLVREEIERVARGSRR